MEYGFWNVAPIVLLPFMAFVINTVIVRKFEKLAIGISTTAILASWGLATRILIDFLTVYSSDYYIHKVFTWFDISFGEHIFKVDMGIYLDNMSAVMLFMVTGAASMIHLFSTWYMNGDKGGFGRFFVYMSLFTSAMLGLVVSDNLLSVFIFWEIMGFCSYSLIGFYNKELGAGIASMKAFMTTRIGDVFFLFGILAIWTVVGNVRFVDIYAAIASGSFDGLVILGIPLATAAAAAIFMGTVGKSAQVPLQVWLPDAMWGPTPCSALIHAATMVAAGVYLSLRMYPLMDLGHLTWIIAWIGGITAFGAATVALVQTDIKAVLAYSTISQLGYMVLGVGVGAYNPAFMHLITHAVFKAALFLSAGSIIHALHVQEMPRMGGLRKKLPYTFLVMLLCTFAITGVPGFSGFVSKDRILGDALVAMSHHKIFIVPTLLGFAGAFLTAFYMFRMMFLTFFGEPRDKELFDHTKKEKFSVNRNMPLLILAIFTFGFWFSGSLTGQGIINLFPKAKKEWFSVLIEKPNVEHFKHRSFEPLTFESNNSHIENKEFEHAHYDSSHGMNEEEAHHVHHLHAIGAGISVVIVFLGIFTAAMMYYWKKWDPGFWTGFFSRWTKTIKNKYYFDDLYVGFLIERVLIGWNKLLAFIDMGIYDRFFVDGTAKVAKLLYFVANKFDHIVVDSIGVDGTGMSVKFFNVVLRAFQTGKIQFYFIIMIIVLSGYIWTLNINL